MEYMQEAFEEFKKKFDERYKSRDTFKRDEVIEMFEGVYEGIDEMIDEFGSRRTKTD